IDPFTGLLRCELERGITNTWSLGAPPCLILELEHGSLELIGAHGRCWRTGRISCDGLDAIRFEGHLMHGLARSEPEQPWEPFTLDLSSGRVSCADCRAGARTDRRTDGT